MNDQTSTTPATTSPQDDLQILGADREALCGSLVSYPTRCNLWGDPHYRGNCNGRLVKSLILHYGAKRVADPMMGSGTTEDVVQWLNRERGDTINFWGGNLRTGFNLLRTDLPGQYDFVWLHPPY